VRERGIEKKKSTQWRKKEKAFIVDAICVGHRDKGKKLGGVL